LRNEYVVSPIKYIRDILLYRKGKIPNKNINVLIREIDARANKKVVLMNIIVDK